MGDIVERLRLLNKTTLLPSLQSVMGDAEREILRLRGVVSASATQFEFYVEQHLAKSPPDTAEAAVNKAHAEQCRAALSNCPAPAGEGDDVAELVGTLNDWWKLSLVIESAVRRGDGPRNHADVLAMIYRTQELVKSGALSRPLPSPPIDSDVGQGPPATSGATPESILLESTDIISEATAKKLVERIRALPGGRK